MKLSSRNKIGEKFTVLFLLIFLHSTLYPQMKSDLLLVEKPQELTIYDTYKQELNGSRKSEFPAFTPILIGEIDKTQPLNPMRKVIINDKPYYLGITSGKQIIGYDKAGKKLILHGWKKLNILKLIPMNKRHDFVTPDNKTVKLKKGDAIQLLFFKKNKYLVKLKKNNEYGFIYFSKRELKSLLKEKKAPKALSKKKINNIETEIESYNKKMSTLIKTLNNKYHITKIAPLFTKIPFKNGLKFLFKNGNLADYSKSFSALKKKIEISLIGTNFKIRRERNYLIITR